MSSHFPPRVFIFTREEEPQTGRGTTRKNTRGFALADDGTMLASVLLENAGNCERWLTSGERLYNYQEYYGSRPILYLYSLLDHWPDEVKAVFSSVWRSFSERANAH